MIVGGAVGVLLERECKGKTYVDADVSGRRCTNLRHVMMC